MSRPVRVRFAPSPTGALHIGGVRTALYNYLWAKKHNGTFILRIEDTDQTRYVEGAENYIMEALQWVGLLPDESPAKGGAHVPYRQSERKDLYKKYTDQLIANGKAYYAFDTAEELDAIRKAEEANGNKGFKYDAITRQRLRNSLTLSADEVQTLLHNGTPYVIRLRVEPNEIIAFNDMIRGNIEFSSNEVDDKVLLKSDGMPTYHLANIVDDYLMEISHVIRGEEWLPSTPTHVLLYRAFGWQRPEFAHLPLILRPDGKGKLSKRDGAKFGMPVFPLDFVLPNVTGDDAFIKGFREWGFEPEAVINFLALLGWSSSDGREFFTIDELAQQFDIAAIHKTGARFDFDKAKWFNQQYLMKQDDATLATKVRPFVEKQGVTGLTDAYLQGVCKMLKERVHFLAEYYSEAQYFYHAVDFDNNALRHKATTAHTEELRKQHEQTLKKIEDTKQKIYKKWAANAPLFRQLQAQYEAADQYTEQALHDLTFAFMETSGLKTGDVLPVLRMALSGTIQGASVFEMAALFGKNEVAQRLTRFFQLCDEAAAAIA